MNSERWQQVETLYHEALEQDSGARAAFLARACGSDDELRREVEALLKYDRQAASFIERPTFELEARAMVAETPRAESAQESKHSSIPRQIGPYKLLEPLGKGGMGEVHLALDARLNRKVAIKLLPAEFTADAERVRRFEQEAQAASALNHPNIMTVYEIGEIEGRRFIVTEYIEGKTLRQQMASAPQQRIKLTEALEIAAQVASALQAAHEAGIMHRDIKPENVMTRQDGLVKILDFGLAKLTERPAALVDTEAPTMGRVSTETGAVMGTVAYMSPEQARGQKADHRTDIFSLGVMLYEMLSGRNPFEGATASDVIVAVLTSDPVPLGQAVPEVPVALHRIVSRCLEKKPEKRFQSAGDLSFALAELSVPASPHLSAGTMSPAQAQVSESSPMRWQRLSHWRLGWVVAAVATALFIGATVWAILGWRRQPEEKLAAAFTFTVPENWRVQWLGAPAVSPDGRHIVFSANPDSAQARREPALWIRRLDSTEAKILPGTEGGFWPFWSPDSRLVAFFANGRLRKIDISGGSVVTVCEVRGAALPGTWNQEGIILFSTAPRLGHVAAAGGQVIVMDSLADGEVGQYNPRFLPDGKQFLYYSRNRDPQNDGTYVASLDTGKSRKLVLKNAGTAIYVSPGYLLFIRENMLLAQPFDLERLELKGEPVQVAEQQTSSSVITYLQAPFGAFSASENGVLVRSVRTSTVVTQLTWFDRSGRRLETVGEPSVHSGPAFSPHEDRLVVSRLDPKTNTRDLWIVDLMRGTSSRLTFDPADDFNPVWSPDGKWIIFTSTQMETA